MGIDLLLGGLGEPHISSTNLTGKGVEEYPLRVKQMTGLGIIGPLHTKTVFRLLVVEIIDDHRKDISDLTLRGEWNLRIWSGLSLTEKHERAGSRVGRVDREIHTARHVARPVGKGVPVTQTESSVLVSMVKGGAHDR